MGDFTKDKLKIKRLSPDDILHELERFEAQYGMLSDVFYVKYNRGMLGSENRDYMLWAAYYEMAGRAGIIHKAAV